MKILNTIIMLLLCSIASLNTSYAENSANEWQFEATPYLFAAGMDGTIGVNYHDVGLDVSFDDLLDDLDMGFMGLFTAQKGPWIFALEGVYMKLEGGTSGSINGPGDRVSINGELDITNSMYVAQGTMGYRVYDGDTKINAFAALRYTRIEVEMDVTAAFTPPPFSGELSADDSKNWTDFVAGLQVVHPVSNNVELAGYADVGGGGSDLTYQFMADVNWEFKKDYRLKFGYRYLSWDYEDKGFKWDVAASGPYLGLGIRF